MVKNSPVNRGVAVAGLLAMAGLVYQCPCDEVVGCHRGEAMAGLAFLAFLFSYDTRDKKFKSK